MPELTYGPIRCGMQIVQFARLHDCRHSFAWRTWVLGEGLPKTGKLLGPTQVETTARCAQLAQHSVRGSAVRVPDSTAADILGDYEGGG